MGKMAGSFSDGCSVDDLSGESKVDDFLNELLKTIDAGVALSEFSLRLLARNRYEFLRLLLDHNIG